MMDFFWVIGIVVYMLWKLHKRYPGIPLLLIGTVALPVIGIYLPKAFFGENNLASQIGGVIGLLLIWPFSIVYMHFLSFVPQIKKRVIAEETEKIIIDRKRNVELSNPNEHEVIRIVSDPNFFTKYYAQYFKSGVPGGNPLVDPESPLYYKTSRSVMWEAKCEWRRRELKKIDNERDAIEASCMEEIEEKRWFKKKKEHGEQFVNPYESMPFNDMVISRVQSISPTDQQLANFMSNIYVPGLSGKITRYTVDEWLCMFSKLPEKKDEALILWRDECARRIIASGKWPDGFHE